MGQATSPQPTQGSLFPTERRRTASRSGFSPTDRSAGQTFGRARASSVPLTRREFEAARFQTVVARTARKMPSPTVPSGPSTPLRCPRCRTTNDHAARFCDRCGRSLRPLPAAVPGLTRAVRVAMARDLKESAARVATRQRISEAAASQQVRRTSGTPRLPQPSGG